MKTAEIFSIGDELLRGIVLDTNSNWMAKRLAARGGTLQRVTVLGDTPPVVATALRDAVDRAPVAIFTQGGLGPTDDDRTREAVATALGVSLERNAEAERIVSERYAALAQAGTIPDGTLNDARARMGLVPQGATPLANGVGGAPGLIVPAGESTIVCLPGVPEEMHWIWDHSLAPHLDRLYGPGGYDERTLLLEEKDESRIAGIVRAVAERHPDVYVKSRATAFGQPDERVRLTFSAVAGSDEEARRRVEAAAADAREALAGLGVDVASSSGRSAST